jgi:SAM-dependent methyltransferase
MQDSWKSGDPYEYYMGRWSKLVAELFVDWLSPRSGLRWLDVGCGSGVLSKVLIKRCKPETITAIDQSECFVSTTQKRLGSMAKCMMGNALSLPLNNSSVNMAVAGLVLNFLPEPEQALTEMKRVTTKGGTVAVYIWDYAGIMEFLNHFWNVTVELDPTVSELHEGRRFTKCNVEELNATFNCVGFSNIEATSLEIATKFSNFDDYWIPFLGGQGPAPTYVSKIGGSKRIGLKNALLQRLPINEDGSISLSARAWAIKGIV